MKKVILAIGATLLLASVVFVSCKKENATQIQPESTAATANTPMKTISKNFMNVTVDDYGFLVFASTEDVDQYVDFLLSHSLEQVTAFLEDKGFTSLAGNKYDNLDQSTLIKGDQVKDFMLNMNGLVEINETVFKLTADDLSLLTIQKNVLDDTNLEAFKNENFDESKMNRFAVYQVREENFNLFETIAEYQLGINEDVVAYPGGGQASLMKFWGTTESAGPCDPGGQQLVTVTHYAFWIKSYSYYYRPCQF